MISCIAGLHRLSINELGVMDITEHPTREGKVFCAAVPHACCRKTVGWAIDFKQDSTLVVNALDMALRARTPAPGGSVHADHGVQFTSWAFTQKIRTAGLLPSFGTVGDALDNAMMESFWSSMQIELLNLKKWTTRSELANAIFEYIEVFYNRKRRHSSLGYQTPTDFDFALSKQLAPPEASDRNRKPNCRSGHLVSLVGVVILSSREKESWWAPGGRARFDCSCGHFRLGRDADRHQFIGVASYPVLFLIHALGPVLRARA